MFNSMQKVCNIPVEVITMSQHRLCLAMMFSIAWKSHKTRKRISPEWDDFVWLNFKAKTFLCRTRDKLDFKVKTKTTLISGKLKVMLSVAEHYKQTVIDLIVDTWVAHNLVETIQFFYFLDKFDLTVPHLLMTINLELSLIFTLMRMFTIDFPQNDD